MKKKIAFVSVIALILLAAAYRFVQVAPYPQGGGRYEESPDKQFTADAANMTDCTYFGGKRSYYEFTIEAKPNQRLRHIVVEIPSDGMIQWRGEGIIQWAADSSSVSFGFQGTQLTLAVKP